MNWKIIITIILDVQVLIAFLQVPIFFLLMLFLQTIKYQLIVSILNCYELEVVV